MKNSIKSASPAKIIVIGFIVVFCCMTIISSFSIIPTGYTGVRTTFGQISSTPVNAGFNWKIPFVQSIEKVNNKQQDVSFGDKVWSETSERTAIYFEGITVTYTINGEKSAWIYANVSDYRQSLVNGGIVASSIKAASKKLSSTDATNRGLIEPLTQKTLQKSLDDKYGKEVVFVNKIVISNIDFDASYNEAIAKKQNAQLAYEQQQIANKQAVEKAEADAAVKKKTAEGEAEATKIKAKAEAEANSEVAKSLSENVLKNKYYEKWDGKLPQVYGADGTLVEIPTTK